MALKASAPPVFSTMRGARFFVFIFTRLWFVRFFRPFPRDEPGHSLYEIWIFPAFFYRRPGQRAEGEDEQKEDRLVREQRCSEGEKRQQGIRSYQGVPSTMCGRKSTHFGKYATKISAGTQQSAMNQRQGRIISLIGVFDSLPAR